MFAQKYFCVTSKLFEFIRRIESVSLAFFPYCRVSCNFVLLSGFCAILIAETYKKFKINTNKVYNYWNYWCLLNFRPIFKFYSSLFEIVAEFYGILLDLLEKCILIKFLLRNYYFCGWLARKVKKIAKKEVNNKTSKYFQKFELKITIFV